MPFLKHHINPIRSKKHVIQTVGAEKNKQEKVAREEAAVKGGGSSQVREGYKFAPSPIWLPLLGLFIIITTLQYTHNFFLEGGFCIARTYQPVRQVVSTTPPPNQSVGVIYIFLLPSWHDNRITL